MSESPLEEVLRDAASVLRRLRAPYALIGGVGAIYHGSTRATRDVDLSVGTSGDDLAGISDGLRAAGFTEIEMRGAVLQARHPNGYRLDLLQAQSELEREIIASSRDLQLAKAQCVRLARVEDIVVFKLVGGRPRDWRDIEELIEVNAEVDFERICSLLGLLGVMTTPSEWVDAEQCDDLRPLLKRLSAAVRDPG